MMKPFPKGIQAFSLIEVMIALAIFFTASFVILALVSSGLRTARMLRMTRPSASIHKLALASGGIGKMNRILI